MIQTQTKVDGLTAGLLSFEKQLRFAVALTATLVAKESQQAAIAKIQETFITRNDWFAPTNRFGVHLKPATVADPSAEVTTSAYWLVPHELGALKEPRDGPFLAIPTDEIQPNIREPIPSSRRPRNLAGAFLLETARGPAIFQRINNQLRRVYTLVHQVRLERQSTIIQPTIDTVRERFSPLLGENLEEAMRTAK